MPPAVPIDPRVSMRAQLAYTLRLMRELRGLTQDQLAKELYVSRETIAAYESQRHTPDEEFCKRLDEFFGTGELFQSLWHHAQREHLSQWFEMYLSHEFEATQIRTFQPLYIPGLLQADGYVQELAKEGKVSAEMIEQRVARREILTRPHDPPVFFAVLDQAAISRPVGGSHVMKEQLRHLLEMGELPHVSIQVVQDTTGWYLGFGGALVSLTKPENKTVGYVEAQFGGRLIEDPAEASRVALRFDLIRSKALSEDASRDLIRKTMETMLDDRMAQE